MKIIITIIVLGILVLAFVGAVSLGIVESDFTKDVVSISTVKICESDFLSNVFNEKCENIKSEIEVNQDVLSIKEDTKTGGIRIRNE